MVPIPNHWTPLMYLALLDVTIEKEQVIKIHKITINGVEIPCLNKVHLSFEKFTYEELHSWLMLTHPFYETNFEHHPE